MHTERIYNTMRCQYRGIDTHSLASGWLVIGLHSGGCGNQVGATKGDSSRDGELTSEIEPVVAVRSFYLPYNSAGTDQPVTQAKNPSMPLGAKIAAQK